MKIGVYPGSFDPVTNGHLDIIERASKIFDKLIVAVLVNPNKTPVFDIEERVELLKETTEHLPNVEVKAFKGLLIDFMKQENAKVIVKGLRAVSDFEYEFQMALLNKKLEPSIETIFMMTNSKYSYLSSSMVKEVARFGGCIEDLVPEKIAKKVMKKLNKKYAETEENK
ncbi:pantetheine-phosphate adenylyltransferase [Caldicellulosiruptor acetigenus I77R1B]|uniref:Phosphopantetheine adenylyltransferase n=7 Tax=Caldicellulosiruptoraceae TaxID=3071002 RepID=E4Q122_CALOW|nr:MULTISPECIES: pantetheine-phosphate adenylyltransferase [Caldicellulosiruptor]ADQ04581.1 pantetheine-phosphate adenylyltransferase [Caldicellulosiruptor owensensis OL]ADQ07215.1 pantetheine-phosphate adenylyltransferase [Caldicellulosiruptor hydrothermalis 108]ADQ40716.1 pantetheine-phosphate adenylyltransferase [Caldicellulosiruptor acetigenus I77R1B]AEM73267.1 Phosphopantetheine adenylyltransferase [Caldicellulosiruptor acetigenus 6A]WAM35179.1 pantetheine-phosphate adenylyltransferase [C